METWKLKHTLTLLIGGTIIALLCQKTDPYKPQEETKDAIYGIPKVDPTRTPYKFDYEHNKWIYDKHVLDPETPVKIDYQRYMDEHHSKNKKKNTIYNNNRGYYPSRLETQLNDYIWDNEDDILDRTK